MLATVELTFNASDNEYAPASPIAFTAMARETSDTSRKHAKQNDGDDDAST